MAQQYMDEIIIQEKTFEKARNKIKKAKSKNPKSKILFVSGDDKLSRKILEKTNIDILTILQSKRKDYQKQRNSGFNHVLAKIAKKNGIQIGIYMNEIISSKGKNKSDIIARVIQNIKLCKKNHIQMQFVGDLAKTKNLHDKKALGLVLGMPTWMTKNLK